MKEKILIIDDDKKLNNLLKDFFSSYEYTVSTVIHPDEGLQMLYTFDPDIIILDIMLPDMDGFEVCRKIRKESTVPIIMLTARGEVTDRIVGLELGADDYMPKPFEPRELIARIQSVLRRTKNISKSSTLNFNELTIELKSQKVILKEDNLDLTTMEFELLKYFAKNPDIVLNRDQIIEKLKGFDWDSYDRSIDVLISRLRNKLKDDPKNPSFIKTIWGRGYMFLGE